jgi:hypothetical protein
MGADCVSDLGSRGGLRLYRCGGGSCRCRARVILHLPSHLPGSACARSNRSVCTIGLLDRVHRVIEPIVVSIIAEGWSIVLSNEGFALRSPMQHAPAIEAALSDLKSLGLKAAARLLLAAAPTVKASLSESWEQLLRQISGNGSRSLSV